ncbi:TIGR01459 family HAD-type hydrolase [Sinorhizobium sp. BG8]|uniref:TIGR01459 family HAD-type hydrolase n=1 Tax=Sinorhizobium sp. BG8 TaxID=2613773 RepID=UPI00193DFF0F|nr:TIGR01459 family HAD-type hydrolase [Sinorhizobium sp. BG8]QRM57373.1 TIGR01459 family HAD-type hydrolase [Sinorhizobium sp. BG8]
MNHPQRIHFDTLLDRYDVFLIDQFGVLRDDAGPYEGASRALVRLKAAGKTVVILSNSGRSGAFNANRIRTLGFTPEMYDHFLTSGDVAYSLLSRPGSPVQDRRNCFTISSGGDTELADRLHLTSVPTADDADIVVIAGSEAESVSLATYRDMLRPAAERGLACFCTNPDFHKLANGSTAPGAGTIANLYEELGGKVTRIGKPYPQIYDRALALCGNPDKRIVACIGDSIDHDVAGASGVGLDSVLVETGILSGKSDAERTELMQHANATPTYMIARLHPDC